MYPLRLDTESDYESMWVRIKVARKRFVSHNSVLFSSVYMVSEDEWKELSNMFKVDKEIAVCRHREGPNLLTADPPVCTGCVDERNRQEEELKLTYSNEPIYIRKLAGSELPPEFDAADPEYEQSKPQQNGEPSHKKPKFSNKISIPSDLVRRSNRRQKVRGEKEFFVNSTMLLRDLKVKVTIAIVLSCFWYL